ncbi:MAG: hypothetical protein DRJ37_04835 [Thermoprotei archaeon]|nr:MAG: hypothetical protein DRJ37_04835 [Thermoprotei archaeon]
MRRLTRAVLEEIAEILDILNSENSSPVFNPSVAVLSALILAFTASFSQKTLVPLFLILASVAMAFFLEIDLKLWIKPVVLTFLATVVISAPLILLPENAFLFKPEISRIEEALFLILRATAASAIFTILIIHIGWTKLLEGLRGLCLPEEFVFLIGFSIKYIPVFLRDTCKLVAAKEARMLKGLKYKTAWRSMAAVAGEILLRSYEKSLKLHLALNARMFYIFPSTPLKHSINTYDVVLLICTALIVAAMML